MRSIVFLQTACVDHKREMENFVLFGPGELSGDCERDTGIIGGIGRAFRGERFFFLKPRKVSGLHKQGQPLPGVIAPH